ncbi:MAG: hypothetical protein J7L15_04120, partial [Clostridiales bacterium]|nr:hypothetical protein [Clostridiales bacterium]
NDTYYKYNMQESSYEWSTKDNELIVDLVPYQLIYISYKENDDPSLDDDETILVGVFRNEDEEIDDIEIEFDNDMLDVEVFVAIYLRHGDEEIYIHIEPAIDIPEDIYEEETISLTPIVPMKEDGKLIQSTLNMRKMMNKLNVSADDFEEALTDTDDDGEPLIDNAYLINGLPLRNPYEVRVGDYTPTEAESLSTGLLQVLRRNDLSETGNRYPGQDKSEVTSYTVTEEIAEEWYQDHLKEQTYLARGLFRTFGYYAGAYNAEAEDKMSLFYMNDEIKDGEFSALRQEEEEEEEEDNGVSHEDLINEASSYSGGFFSKRVTDTGGVSFSMEKLSMSYNFDISITTYEGTVRGEEGVTNKREQGYFHFSGTTISKKDDEGDRTNTQTEDSEGFDQLVLRVQKNKNEYQEMIITNYQQNFQISGKGFRNTLGSPADEHRIIIPYHVFRDIKFNEYVTIHEHSFALLAYAIKTVTIKWYERFAGIIIAGIICVATGGAGCGIAAFIIKAIVSIIITLVLEKLMEMIDSDILKLILQIVVLLVNMYMNGFDFEMLTVENYLQLATQVSSMALNAYSVHLAKEEAEKKKEEDAEERIEDRVGEYDSAMTLYPKADMSAHFSSAEMNSPEVLYRNLLGENLYNFDQFYDVDSQIELRKQVVPG